MPEPPFGPWRIPSFGLYDLAPVKPVKPVKPRMGIGFPT